MDTEIYICKQLKIFIKVQKCSEYLKFSLSTNILMEMISRINIMQRRIDNATQMRIYKENTLN